MAGADDRPEPLWASSLADQPRRHEDVVRPQLTAVPRETQPRVGQRAIALVGLAAVITVVALAASLTGRSGLAIEDVPSFWGDVQMTCHTARFTQDQRALELFRCHAVDGGTLPPGVYTSPEATWTSDITRRDARVNRIRISPDGELTGWAAY
jgi:hypothetical protein